MRCAWFSLRVAVACGVLGLAGCTSITSLFNEEFLQSVSLGPRVASLPGDAPAVLVTVENRTTRLLEAQVSYRTLDDAVETYITTVQAGEKTAQAIPCPITEATLGDVSNLDEVGAIIRLGAGTAADPFIEVEPFGVLLQDGVNFDCGDSVTFAVVPSGVTLSGFQVFAFVQRTGQ